MKTSPNQFEMLVTFMEQHGDLSKTNSNARERIKCIENWEELAALLNSHGSIKTTEKWKKAWSDFKNNTKKKAARLREREASSPGGGPRVYARFSDLEKRVIRLMGLQVTTGLAVEEAELSQDIQRSSNKDIEQVLLTLQFEESSDSQNVNQVDTIASSAQSPPPYLRAISSPPQMFEEQEVESSGSSRLSISPAHSPREAKPTVTALAEETGLPAPTRPSTQVRAGHGLASSVHTTSQRARRARKRARPTHTEQASQHFLHADTFWRKFKKQQHRDNIELRREENRIRELDLQVQRDWQALGRRVVNVLEKVADKYCKN